MKETFHKIKPVIIGVVVLVVIGWAITLVQGQRVITATSPPEGWLQLTDPVVGYQFYYPADSTFSSGVERSTGYTRSFFIKHHADGVNEITLYTRPNPAGLPLEQFIQTEDALTYGKPTDLWRTADLHPYVHPLTVVGKQALLVEQSEATFPLVDLCQQAVYIAHQNTVVVAKLCAGQRGVWELGYKAKPAGQALFWDVLSTLTFIE